MTDDKRKKRSTIASDSPYQVREHTSHEPESDDEENAGETDRAAAALPDSDMDRIEKIRRKKKKSRVRRIILALAALLCAMMILSGLLSASINMLSELLDTARIALMPGSGWPISLAVDSPVDAVGLDNGIAVCGRSELVIYSSTGRLLRQIQHGYADPVITAGSTRICVYNRGGKDFSVESRSRTLASKTTDYAILTATMAGSGSLAVATRASEYVSQVVVYSPTFKEVCHIYYSDKYPVRMALSDDGKKLAVCCLETGSGSVGTRLLLYDLSSSSEKASADMLISGSVPLRLSFSGKSDNARLTAVYDGFTAQYELSSLSETARYAYDSKTLIRADIREGSVLLAFGAAGKSSIGSCILLDSSLAQQAEVTPAGDLTDLILEDNGFFLLGNRSVTCYNRSGDIEYSKDLSAECLFIAASDKPLIVTAKEILQIDGPST